MIYALAVIASGIVVVRAATALARYAIAETTKVERLWLGPPILAGATSLPELATDVAALRLWSMPARR